MNRRQVNDMMSTVQYKDRHIVVGEWDRVMMSGDPPASYAIIYWP